MERGGSSNQRQNYPTRTHRTGPTIPTGRAHTDYPIQYPPPQSFKRDPDQYMPIANVARIMRRALPDNAKIADDAKETIQECVSEFIGFVTGKANEICHREYRKTVTPDDVLSAMNSLGLHNYVEPLTAYLEKYRAQDPDREPVGNRAPYVRRVVQRRSAGPVEPPELRAAPPPEPPVGCYVPAMAPSDNYVGMPPDMSGYYMGEGEGGSSEAEFDPFGPHFR